MPSSSISAANEAVKNVISKTTDTSSQLSRTHSKALKTSVKGWGPYVQFTPEEKTRIQWNWSGLHNMVHLQLLDIESSNSFQTANTGFIAIINLATLRCNISTCWILLFEKEDFFQNPWATTKVSLKEAKWCCYCKAMNIWCHNTVYTSLIFKTNKGQELYIEATIVYSIDYVRSYW